jgi:nucleoside-diphosphate-sugar epimerase
MREECLRVLVTGATGLVGSDAVTALTIAGHEVMQVTRHALPSSTLSPTLELDLRNSTAAEAIRARSPDVIVHAAAVLPPRFDGEVALQAAVTNRSIDDTVIAAVRKTSCRLVYLSSTSVYGCVPETCLETSPVAPAGPYGDEKLRSESLILSLETAAIILRVSAPYGVRQRLRTVLWKFIEDAAQEKDLLYYGSGAREQDFTAVEDVSAAIVAALKSLERGVFNISGGQPISMKELARLVLETLGTKQSKVLAAGIPDAQENCRARISISKAEQYLGWQPREHLRSGITKLHAYITNSGDSNPRVPQTRSRNVE